MSQNQSPQPNPDSAPRPRPAATTRADCVVCETPYFGVQAPYVCPQCQENGKAAERIAELEAEASLTQSLQVKPAIEKITALEAALKSYVEDHDYHELNRKECPCELCENARKLLGDKS